MKNVLKGLLKFFLIPLIILMVLISAGLTVYITFQNNREANAFKIEAAKSIQETEYLNLGGIKQWISIRGQDKNNPVLLFLHGGPGSPAAPAVRRNNSNLEDHFIIVNWDQRGSGNSHSDDIPPESMNLQQFVNDTIDLTRILQKRFNEDKIYLVGHSWGSIVGVLAAQQKPELYHAYIGIGQAVNFFEGEKISYSFTKEEAEKRNNTKAIEELEKIGAPPYPEDEFREHVAVQRKWLFEFGGEVYCKETSRSAYKMEIAKDFLFAPEYTIITAFNILSGNQFSVNNLLDDMLSIDFIKEVPRLDLPVYLITGRHDWVTVHPLTEKFYKNLQAPIKELIWFDNSAHSPNFEEPMKFKKNLVRIKEETYY